MWKLWITINWVQNWYFYYVFQIGKVTIDYNEIKHNKRSEFPLLTHKGKSAGTLKLLELAIIEP